MDPTDGVLYCFVSCDCEKMKVLRFETNGWCMYYVRLFEGEFRWRHSDAGKTALQIERRQLVWLLDSLEPPTSSSRSTPPRLQVRSLLRRERGGR